MNVRIGPEMRPARPAWVRSAWGKVRMPALLTVMALVYAYGLFGIGGAIYVVSTRDVCTRQPFVSVGAGQAIMLASTVIPCVLGLVAFGIRRARRGPDWIGAGYFFAFVGGFMSLVMLAWAYFPGPIYFASSLLDRSEAEVVKMSLYKEDSITFRRRTTSARHNQVELFDPADPSRVIPVILPRDMRLNAYAIKPGSPPEVSVRVHPGFLGLRWVEADSPRVRSSLYDFQVLHDVPRGKPEYLLEHRGKVILIAAQIRCADVVERRAFRRVESIMRRFSAEELAVFGAASCPGQAFGEVDSDVFSYACERAAGATCRQMVWPTLFLFRKDGTFAGYFEEPLGPNPEPEAYSDDEFIALIRRELATSPR